MITNKPIKIFGKNEKEVNQFMKPFLMVINGSAGCGKTNICLNIIDIIDHEKDGYNEAWYFSQAGKLDETLRKNINNDDVKLIDSTKDLFEELNEFVRLQKERVDNEEKKIKALLIIDDTTGSDFVKAQTLTGKGLINILKLHRHYNLSVIFIQHRINVINPTLRGLVNFWIVFPVSDEELNIIASNTKLPKNEIFSAYSTCIKNLHSYIMIVNNTREIYCNDGNKNMFKLVYKQFK